MADVRTGSSTERLKASISRPLFSEKADAGDDRLSAGRAPPTAAAQKRRLGLVEAIGHPCRSGGAGAAYELPAGPAPAAQGARKGRGRAGNAAGVIAHVFEDGLPDPQ